MRLIDADKLPRRRYPEYDETGEFIDVMCVKAEDIDNAPTVHAIVLPVKVGQTVYRISGKQITGEYGVYELGIDRQYISDNKISVFCHKICDGATLSSYEVFTSKDIGKIVFTTREAAEEALKAREQNAD